MKEEHDEDKLNPKRSCSKRSKCIAAAVMLSLILVVFIGSILTRPSNEFNTTTRTTFIEGGYYDLKEEQTHKWRCGNDTFPILIDGVSVKLYDKIFTPREIELLKTLNGDSEISTHQIFMKIDQMTRDCQFEYGSFRTRTP